MSLCCNAEEKEKIVRRFKRIEGQMRGLCKMVETDKDCAAVLDQIASATSALKGVWKEIVKAHLNGCVKDSILKHRNAEKVILELVEQIGKLK